MRSAVHALAGDWDAAADALHNARDHDPKHPKTLFLLDYLDRDPYSVAPLGESPVSDFTRWHNGFSALHSAREAEDVVAARNFVSGVGWVDSELQVIEWPELAYLAWTERIRLLLRSGEREAAIQAMVRFREWWPNERAPLSRVSIEAKRLEVLIDGAQ